MTRTTGLRVATLLLWLLGASPAAAQSSAAQRATAEAIFEQAAQLMDERRFSEACEKFAASQELDPALGTLLYLADCYDRAGRSASAWALFREVAERARRAEQPDRQRIAQERAVALESQLSRLELRVPTARQVPGLALFSGGAPVPRASWNAILPVDPGSLRIEARAPGKKPWSTEVKIPAGPSRQVVEVPNLEAVPAARAPALTAAPPPLERPASAQRISGLIIGGLGVGALAVGGFFGYRAYAKNQDSKGDCRADSPNACTPAGTALREQAADAAKISTVVMVGGAVLVASGVTLAVTAPSAAPDKLAENGRARQLGAGWQLDLRGVW